MSFTLCLGERSVLQRYPLISGMGQADPLSLIFAQELSQRLIERRRSLERAVDLLIPNGRHGYAIVRVKRDSALTAIAIVRPQAHTLLF